MSGKDAFAQNRRLGRGVNVIGYDAALWQGSDRARMQEKHFRLIAEAGFNHVRINLHPFKHMSDGPDYVIHPVWLKTLDWAVAQALEVGLLVILDMHEFGAMARDFQGLRAKYLAVWEHVYSEMDHDIYARRLNRDGVPVASEVGVVTTSSSQMRPDVAAHTTNSEYLVVWEHEYSAADHDIHAWRVTTGGIPVSSELSIASSGYNEGYPAVVYNPVAHEYLVVYERYSGSDEFAQYDIYARRVAPGGHAILSGLLTDQGAGVAELYARHGFNQVHRDDIGDWTCLTLRRLPSNGG